MNHSAPKILYTASSSAHLVSFHLPYLAALRSLGWDVTAAANGSGEGLGEGVRFLAVPFTKSFVSPRNFRAAALLARDIRKNRYDVIVVGNKVPYGIIPHVFCTVNGKWSPVWE